MTRLDRRTRRTVPAAAAAAAVVLGVGGFGMTHGSSGATGTPSPSPSPSAGRTPASPPASAPASPHFAVPPSSAPSDQPAPGPVLVIPVPDPSASVPPGVAKAEKAPPITLVQAFPDDTVVLPSGAVYSLVDKQVDTHCTVSPALTELIHRTSGCVQRLTALYTDPARARQITVTVLTMNHAADAATVNGATTFYPMEFQVGGFPPPSRTGIPEVPDGTPAGTAGVVAVRSEVYALWANTNGSPDVGGDFAAQAHDLQAYVTAKVAGYEQGTENN